MSAKQDIRGYVNAVPGTAAATQLAAMPHGAEIYTENRDGKQFDAMRRSLRKGSIVAVFELYCLAPAKGGPAKRRRTLLERMDAIDARGAKVQETTGTRKPREMLLHAYEQIATSGRARKRKVKGAPVVWPKPPATLKDYRRHWFDGRHANDKARRAAIIAEFGSAPSISTLRNRLLGSPHKTNVD
jgi:hypothetical protein